MLVSPVLSGSGVSKRFVTHAQRATQLEERVVAGTLLHVPARVTVTSGERTPA